MNKKIAPFLLLIGILLIPTVTHASWWNPFSWFRKKITAPVVQVQKASPTVVPVVATPAPVPVQSKEKIKTNSSLNKETIKYPVTPQVVPVQTPVPVITPAVNTPVPAVQLVISNVSVVPTITSAQISWDTNIVSESKIILNGIDYSSQQGVGTYHSVIIKNLAGGLTYQGVITALANNAWTSLPVTIITNPAPILIPTPTPPVPTAKPTKPGHSTSA